MIKYDKGFKTASLEVIDRELRDGIAFVRVLCACGTKKWIRAKSLLYTASCGCLQGKRQSPKSDLEDAVGKTFGQLTILETWIEDGRRLARVRCSCGKVKSDVLFWNIARRGSRGVVSCGCASPGGPGWIPDPTKPRVSDPLGWAWRRWIGRGMVAEWAGSWPVFRQAVADLGPCPDGYHLGRIDHRQPMGPGNVGWVCPSQSLAHSRRNLLIEHDGEEHTASGWAAKLGISRQAMQHRLRDLPRSEAFAPRDPRRVSVSTQATCTICHRLLDTSAVAMPGGRAHAACVALRTPVLCDYKHPVTGQGCRFAAKHAGLHYCAPPSPIASEGAA